jgi:hypothetical protein
MKLLICLLFLFAPAMALAQERPSGARSIADCETIKNDMAYNNCLASFGPKRGERPAGMAAASEGGGRVQRASRRGGRSARRGRVSASFEVRGSRARAGSVSRVKSRGTRSRRSR